MAVFGSTGYIGRKVTEEMISRGFNVVAVAREQSGIGGKQGRSDVQAMFPDATVKFSDVTDVEKLKKDVFDTPVDVVVCCLASRTGGIKDSWLVDYQVRLRHAPRCSGGGSVRPGAATRCSTPRAAICVHRALSTVVHCNSCLVRLCIGAPPGRSCGLGPLQRVMSSDRGNGACGPEAQPVEATPPPASMRSAPEGIAREPELRRAELLQASKNCMDAAVAASSSHFVLLSAICVQKPLLEFQRAKLKFEAELQATEALTHSIVRPTAFFKSLAGQVESVKKGGPYVMFGDGHLAACKPISEEDLATFMGDCVLQQDKVNQARRRSAPTEPPVACMHVLW